jgi:hypothetical protein
VFQVQEGGGNCSWRGGSHKVRIWHLGFLSFSGGISTLHQTTKYRCMCRRQRSDSPDFVETRKLLSDAKEKISKGDDDEAMRLLNEAAGGEGEGMGSTHALRLKIER